MPYDDAPAFMASLRARQSLAAIALEMTILTACRTSEVLGARWDEFDLDKAIWVIPKERMKAGHAHRIPLSKRLLTLLKGLPRISPYVLPGQNEGKPLSGMSMEMQLRRMDRNDITVHGFRSTFRDWASEQTSFPHETAEHALAHRISDRAEAAYRRGDQFEKRRDLMEAWAAYCEPEKAGKVVKLKRKG
jgi:integrase